MLWKFGFVRILKDETDIDSTIVDYLFSEDVEL